MAGADPRAMKLAMNQSACRDANEKLEHAAKSHHFDGQYRVPFLCECGDADCFATVMLGIDEYEHIRAHPIWFFLVAGHEDEERSHERVVVAERGYAIVEKIGAAGAEATRLDPREHGRAS